jgi:hypothetical protein
MSQRTGVRQADGTICRKGANCKRHSLSASIAQQIKTVNSAPKKVAKPKPTANVKPVITSHPLLLADGQVRSGLNGPQGQEELEQLHQDYDTLIAAIEVSEKNILGRYKHNAFRYVNNYLIGGADYIKSFHLKNKGVVIEEDALESSVNAAKRDYPQIDAVFKKYEKISDNKPRALYRSFRVFPSEGNSETSPEDIKNYVQQNYKVGETVTNKSYTSTSIDSDFVLVDAARKPEQIIVHEIVSSKGLPLYKRSGASQGIQNAEKEVLLPREATFRVVNITEATYDSSYEDHDILPFPTWDGPVPQKKKFTVIQMVQE